MRRLLLFVDLSEANDNAINLRLQPERNKTCTNEFQFNLQLAISCLASVIP